MKMKAFCKNLADQRKVDACLITAYRPYLWPVCDAWVCYVTVGSGVGLVGEKLGDLGDDAVELLQKGIGGVIAGIAAGIGAIFDNL